MEISLVKDAQEFLRWKSQWEQLHTSSQYSVFISHEWVTYHLKRSTKGFVLLVCQNGSLIAGLPLCLGRLSNKPICVQTLEHLCKAHTDYHEFIFAQGIDVTDLANFISRYMYDAFPQALLKIDFPPSDSATEYFLKAFLGDYEVMNMGVHYLYHYQRDIPLFDKKLLADIDRRTRRLRETTTLNFELNEKLTPELLNEVLDLHRTYHGNSSLNCKSTRHDVVALLTIIESKVLCSTLRLNGRIAACAISFTQDQEIQYFAPAIDSELKISGLGLMLLAQIKGVMAENGFLSLCYLRGEEAYKVRVSNVATAVRPFLGVPTNIRLTKHIFTKLWVARRNQEVASKREALNQSFQKRLKHNKAIVIANGLNGLGVVRALNKANIETTVICASTTDLSAISQLPKRCYIEPNGDDWDQRVLKRLAQIAQNSSDLIPLYTCSDKAANFVEKNYALLPKNIRCLFPPGDLTRTLNDKQSELALMDKYQIPIPHSVWAIDSEKPFDKLKLPIIIKPKDFRGYDILRAKNRIVDKPEDLEAFYQEFSSSLNEFVAQELIKGTDENLWVCNATFDQNSQLISAFTFRRMGTSPSHFGVTSMALSEQNGEIKQLVARFGQALNYVGPGMWEFKYCEETQQYLYIETNPRLGMCNWFDTQCNVSNVLVNYQLCIGHKVNPLLWQQSTALFFVNVLGDFVARIEDQESFRSIIKRLYRIFPGPIVWSTRVTDDTQPTRFMLRNQLTMILKRVTKRFKRY